MEKNPNTNTFEKKLKKYFDTKLDAIKDQFTEKNGRLARRMKTDAQPKLCYSYDQVQHDLNNSTVAQLDDLLMLIKKQSIKKALEMIRNLIVDIKSRNKLIITGDKSPDG